MLLISSNFCSFIKCAAQMRQMVRKQLKYDYVVSQRKVIFWHWKISTVPRYLTSSPVLLYDFFSKTIIIVNFSIHQWWGQNRNQRLHKNLLTLGKNAFLQQMLLFFLKMLLLCSKNGKKNVFHISCLGNSEKVAPFWCRR